MTASIFDPSPGRVPKTDLDAEAAVLSASVLSTEACDESLAMLSPVDFYSGANRQIFEAIRDLALANEKLDIVSLASKLRERNRLDQVGGTPYLAQIIDATPSVANVRSHCRLVLDCARIRRAGEVAHQFAAEAYGPIPNPKEWLQRFEQAAYQAASDERQESTAATFGEGAREAFTAIKEAAQAKSETVGLPTGFQGLDDDVGGLAAGDLWLIGGRPGSGKAQPLDAPVLTPTGWRSIGDLKIGDLVIGSDGSACKVTGVFDQGEREVFRVTLSDGGSTECCEEHLWLTRTRVDRRLGKPGSVKSLAEVRSKLKRGVDGGLNHSIPFVAPVEFDAISDLPVDPWLLGIYLGDGFMGWNAMISNPEPDIRARIARMLPEGSEITPTANKDMRIRGPVFLHQLNDLGLKKKKSFEKFIPQVYLTSSVKDRTALLQGLCDADGFVTNCSTIEYLTSSPQLRDDIVFLVGSLGGRVTWQPKATHYTKAGVRHPCREAYRMIISFSNGVVPVSSVKHVAKYKFGGRRLSERYIAKVEPSRRALCRCIAVSAPDRLYVTNDFIVTHNTSWAMQMLENVSALKQPNGAPYGVIMFSMEMKRRQLLMRSLARRCAIPFRNLRLGRLLPDQWAELVEQGKVAKTVPMIIDDGRGLTPYRLRSKIRRHLTDLRNKFGSELKLGAVGIDYIQLMNANDSYGGHDNRANELGTISKDMKQQAGELETTVVALSSLKRPDNKIKVPKPQMTDLRESGALDFDADVIMMLHRDDSYREKHEARDHLADLIVCKSRNSDTSTHIVQFDGRVYGFYPPGYVLFPEEQQSFGQQGEWHP